MKIVDKIFLSVLSIACSSCSRLTTPSQLNLIPKASVEVLWNIDFQAGFLNDTVNLTVNNMSIFDNSVINSESTSAYSGVKVTCYIGDKNLIPKFLHIFTSKVNKIIDYNTPESDSLDFVINIKTPSGLESIQKVRIGKVAGKYIGISKSQGDAVVLYIRQNNLPFLYY